MSIEETAIVELLMAIGRVPHSVNEGISLGHYSKEDGESIKEEAKKTITNLLGTIGVEPDRIEYFWGL